MATRHRQARWDGLPPLRLDARMYFGPVTIGGSHGVQHGVTSYLLLANAAACLASKVVGRWSDIGGPDAQERLHELVLAVFRYPNIAPDVEARLAPDELTVAEHLIARAARQTRMIAKLYAAAAGADSDFGRVATTADMLAVGALRTVYEGVQYTLRQGASAGK
jgi:hypothetical protein